MKTLGKLSVVMTPLLISISTANATALEINLKNNSTREKQSSAQLIAINNKYNLSHWTYTKRIEIEEGAIPHSNPVLTLNTRHLKNDTLMLSTFIHEQMHWRIDKNPQSKEGAINNLKAIYPKIPVGYPNGSEDAYSSYEHLLVIFLELKGMDEVAGPKQEAIAYKFFSNDHYCELYKIVHRDRNLIGKIMKKYGIL